MSTIGSPSPLSSNPDYPNRSIVADKKELYENARVLYQYDISDITVDANGRLYKSNLGFFGKIAAKLADWFSGGKVEELKNAKIRQTLNALDTTITSIAPEGVSSSNSSKVSELGIKILYNGNFSKDEIKQQREKFLKKGLILEYQKSILQNLGKTLALDNHGQLHVASLGDRFAGFFTDYSEKVQELVSFIGTKAAELIQQGEKERLQKEEGERILKEEQERSERIQKEEAERIKKRDEEFSKASELDIGAVNLFKKYNMTEPIPPQEE